MSALDNLRAFLAPVARRYQDPWDRLVHLEHAADAVLADVDAGHLIDVRRLDELVTHPGNPDRAGWEISRNVHDDDRLTGYEVWVIDHCGDGIDSAWDATDIDAAITLLAARLDGEK